MIDKFLEFEVDGIFYLDPRSLETPLDYNPINIQYLINFKSLNDTGAPMIWEGMPSIGNLMEIEVDEEFVNGYVW